MSFGLASLRTREERLNILGDTHSSGLLDIGEEEGIQRGEVQNWHLSQPLPKPCKYKGLGTKKFGSFKKNYEAYARSMWGENKEGWRIGLEAVLEGHPLALYQLY